MATKKMPGRSNASTPKAPEFKPSIWFEGSQIPASLKNAKPGAKVNLTVTATVTRRSEGLKGDRSVSIEVDKIKAPTKGRR